MQGNIRVFLANIENLSDSLQEHLLNTLPTTQKIKALTLKNKKRQREFIVGRTLLIQALRDVSLFSSPFYIEENVANSPTIKGLENIYLSISHSKHLVCCALHDAPVGVDLEYKRKRENFLELSDLFMTQDEMSEFTQLLVDSDKKHFFYQVWCTKEAIYKALDKDTQKHTTLSSIALARFFKDGNEWSQFQSGVGNYHLSLVYRGGPHQIKTVCVEL